ncbi:unnamed protein product, partial [Allacma fusca]
RPLSLTFCSLDFNILTSLTLY